MRGLVLAGGKSRRFGEDKAMAVYRGETFLARAVRTLAELRLRPLIMTREEAPYALEGADTVHDSIPEKGPLGGIYTAMHLFPGNDWLVLTCDMPALEPPMLFPLLNAFRRNHVPSYYYAAEGRLEPFPGIYPGTLYPEISRKISEEKLAMRGLLDSIPEKNTLLFEGMRGMLSNVNCPEDYRHLQTSDPPF